MKFLLKLMVSNFLLLNFAFAISLSCDESTMQERVFVSKYNDANNGLVSLDWNVSTSPHGSNEQVVYSDLNHTTGGFWDISYANDGKLYGVVWNTLVEIDPSTGKVISDFLPIGDGNYSKYYNFELVGDREGYLYTVASYSNRKAVVKFLPSSPSSTMLVAYVDTLGLVGDGDLAWSEGFLYWTATTAQGDPSQLVKIDVESGDVSAIPIKTSTGDTFKNADALFNDSSGTLYFAAQDSIYSLEKDTGVAVLAHLLNYKDGEAGGATTTHAFCASVPSLKNIGEYRFDNCDSEWKLDSSNNENNVTGGAEVTIPEDDGKTYMLTSLSSYDNNSTKIPHHPSYEVDEGTISMLIYDHHDISTFRYNLLEKGNLLIKAVQVDGNNTQGSIDITLDGYTIHTNEVYWTTKDEGDDLDSEWVHFTFTFGLEGMKLYINGVLKGTHPYTGGLKGNSSDFILPNISGYYDELYIFDGQATSQKVEELYTNTINNKNIDGTPREGECVEPTTNGDTVLFNVERTNSDTEDNATQIRKEALYTQIVGRDFNYAVVAYDENETNMEAPIEDVTLRVELIDHNSSNERVLYEDYLYFDAGVNSSRLKREIVDDLNLSIATRDARYRVHYIVDSNGSIVKGRYDNLVDYNQTRALHSEKASDSRDNFAIRPETFYMIISDGNITRKINRDGDSTPLKVASGYNYNLTVIATQYRANNTVYPSLDYNTTIDRVLEFGSSSLCDNDSNVSQKEYFKDGKNSTPLFEHNNVGLYNLKLRDSDWTMVDWNRTTSDCIVEDIYTSNNSNELSGCSIASHSDINLSFYPDHFALNLNMENMPNSGHPDFLYMSELNSTYSRMGISFKGDIVAQSEDNETTTNFTKGCVATNLLLNLDTTTISVEGTNQAIHTTKGSSVNFSRLIHFNNTLSNFDFNNTLQEINGTVKIDSDRFLDENNGVVSIDMRYNINKHPTEPINPVEVSFHSIDVSSIDANSISHDKVNIDSTLHTPKGEIVFLNNRRNFYFVRVVSDLNTYPRVNMQVSSLIRTPLNVDIFCSTIIVDYCKDRAILDNTNLTGTIREQTGWYLSSNHNGLLDGNVITLTGSNTPTILAITPNSGITLDNGANGMVMVKFNNCNSPESIITIKTDPALAFDPSQYVVSCRDSNTSLAGIGKAGNILTIKPEGSKSGKIDW